MELPEEPKVGVAFGAESLQKKLGPFKGPFNGVNQQEIHDFFSTCFCEDQRMQHTNLTF